MKRILTLLFCIGFLFSMAQKQKLKPETLWEFGRLSGTQINLTNTHLIYSVSKYNINDNKGISDIYSLEISTKKEIRLTQNNGSNFAPKINPINGKIGFLSTRTGKVEIWEMDFDGNNQTKISDLKEGINSFDYSPNGTMILYTQDVKLDETVQDIHPDLPKTEAYLFDDLMYRHWDNWTDFKYSHIFISQIKDNKIIDGKDIMKNEPFDSPLSPYFDDSEITWNNDGTKIAYTCKKLSGKEYALSTNSDIYVYDITSDKTINISKGNMGYDKHPSFSADGKKIAWECMKTPGFESDLSRLYVYDFETKTMNDLSRGFDQDVTHIKWTKDSKEIYFISGKDATYQIYKYNLKNKSYNPITKGIHNYTDFIKKDNLLIGTKMSMKMASEVFLINEKNGTETQLTYINKEIYDKYQMGDVEKRWITTTDGKKMLVWVIYPPFFDKNKKYPALLYCQGGPQSAVSQFFSYRWNFQMMAANDYIIVAPNRRGVPTFGAEWNEQISGDYGGQNIKDYLTAIDTISAESFVDEEKLGAVGASYGGYSVYYLAGCHENRFKAFISHCGMFNLESQYGATEEYFFVNHDLEGPYWENKKSYDFSPHKYVKKWNTPILIITGGRDFRIPYTESLQAFNAAQLLGIESKLLFFPDETHFVLKPQNSILWQRTFFEWLDTYLK